MQRYMIKVIYARKKSYILKMIAERISMYLKFKGISVYKFENTIACSRGLISKAIKDNKNIGSEILGNILKAYNDINAEWLITGNGEMLKQKNNANIIAGRDIMSNSHNRTSVSTEEDATDKDMIIKNLQSEINSKDTIIKMLIEKIK